MYELISKMTKYDKSEMQYIIFDNNPDQEDSTPLLSLLILSLITHEYSLLHFLQNEATNGEMNS